MTAPSAPRVRRRIPWSPPAQRRRAMPSGRHLIRGQQAKAGEALLHQQLWCFGADIRRCEGNLLLAYGFLRRRASQGEVGSSAYLHAAAGGSLALWGWGIWYGEPEAGSVFLRRYAFRPKWHPSPLCPDAHTPERLGLWTAPRGSETTQVRALMAALCEAVADYERWVEHYAPGWRRTVLREWDTPRVAAEATVAAWSAWADRFRKSVAPGHFLKP